MGRVVAVIRDLIFSSRISGTARAVDVNTTIVSTLTALEATLEARDVSLVIVDMSLPGDEAVGALKCGAQHASRPKTLAFYSHVQTELREAASKAGADLIMARSRFSESLAEILREYCSAAE